MIDKRKSTGGGDNVVPFPQPNKQSVTDEEIARAVMRSLKGIEELCQAFAKLNPNDDKPLMAIAGIQWPTCYGERGYDPRDHLGRNFFPRRAGSEAERVLPQTPAGR